ncbi:MAG: metal ABC transporter substrate-binding protein [Candidatus Thorarchaeota archaeon]
MYNQGVYHRVPTWAVAITTVLIVSTCVAAVWVVPADSQTVGGLSVLCSIAPLASLVNEIGGAYVKVDVMLPEGVEPHSFTATPELINKAAQADLLVLTGHFAWEEAIADQVTTPGITLGDYEEFGARLSPLEGLAEEHEHDHEGNPHGYWLLPTNAIAIANATRHTLAEMNSTIASIVNANFNLFVQRVRGVLQFISELDQEYHFSDMKVLLVFPAEAYVAETFGMRPVGVIQKGDNIFVSGNELLQIQAELMNHTISLIAGSDTAQLQTAGDIARQLASDTMSRILWWKTMFTGTSDYTTLIAYNAGILTDALMGVGLGNNTQAIYILAALSAVMGLIAVVEAIVIVRTRARLV